MLQPPRQESSGHVLAPGYAGTSSPYVPSRNRVARTISPHCERTRLHLSPTPSMVPHLLGSTLVQRRYKMIVFDFDNTLSTVMLGQPCEAFPKPIEEVSEQEFGGRVRVHLLRTLFSVLSQCGVIFFICTYGLQKRVEVALLKILMCDYFPEGNIVGRESWELQRQGGVKLGVIRARMANLGLAPEEVLFVDDSEDNLRDSDGICTVFCPKSKIGGLSNDEIQSIIDSYTGGSSSPPRALSSRPAFAQSPSWTPQPVAARRTPTRAASMPWPTARDTDVLSSPSNFQNSGQLSPGKLPWTATQASMSSNSLPRRNNVLTPDEGFHILVTPPTDSTATDESPSYRPSPRSSPLRGSPPSDMMVPRRSSGRPSLPPQATAPSPMESPRFVSSPNLSMPQRQASSPVSPLSELAQLLVALRAPLETARNKHRVQRSQDTTPRREQSVASLPSLSDEEQQPAPLAKPVEVEPASPAKPSGQIKVEHELPPLPPVLPCARSVSASSEEFLRPSASDKLPLELETNLVLEPETPLQSSVRSVMSTPSVIESPPVELCEQPESPQTCHSPDLSFTAEPAEVVPAPVDTTPVAPTRCPSITSITSLPSSPDALGVTCDTLVEPCESVIDIDLANVVQGNASLEPVPPESVATSNRQPTHTRPDGATDSRRHSGRDSPDRGHASQAVTVTAPASKPQDLKQARGRSAPRKPTPRIDSPRDARSQRRLPLTPPVPPTAPTSSTSKRNNSACPESRRSKPSTPAATRSTEWAASPRKVEKTPQKAAPKCASAKKKPAASVSGKKTNDPSEEQAMGSEEVRKLGTEETRKTGSASAFHSKRPAPASSKGNLCCPTPSQGDGPGEADLPSPRAGTRRPGSSATRQGSTAPRSGSATSAARLTASSARQPNASSSPPMGSRPSSRPPSASRERQTEKPAKPPPSPKPATKSTRKQTASAFAQLNNSLNRLQSLFDNVHGTSEKLLEKGVEKCLEKGSERGTEKVTEKAPKKDKEQVPPNASVRDGPPKKTVGKPRASSRK